MRTIRLFFSAVLFLVITSAWAAPPFPAPGNLAETVATLQAQVAALQGQVTTLNGQVSALQTDLANANSTISSLQTTVAQNGSSITTLQNDLTSLQQTVAGLDVTALEGRVAAIEGNTVLALDGLLFLDNTSGYATAQFRGVNVQVVNGAGATNYVNGLGNLIVGYNSPRTTGDPTCSDGQYDNEFDCETAGKTWALSHKTGSHNIVGGDHNSYSKYGGVVFGDANSINGTYTTVTGGYLNVASRYTSSVSGGSENTASWTAASVSGGRLNNAGGSWSSVSGGYSRNATGGYDWAAGSLYEDQ